MDNNRKDMKDNYYVPLIEHELERIIRKTNEYYYGGFYLIVSERVYNYINTIFTKHYLYEGYTWVCGIQVYKGLGLEVFDIIPIIKSKQYRNEQEAKIRN